MAALTGQTTAPGDHVVQFYDRSQELVESVAPYLGEALRAAGAAVVVATPAHRMALEARLAADGVDLGAAARGGAFVALDARGTLDSLLVEGCPDRARFDAVVGDLVRRASRPGGPLHVYGEMVDVLWDGGRVAAAIELEGLWNDLRTEVPFSLLCAYRSGAGVDPHRSGSVRDVCRLHTHVLGAPPAVLVPAGADPVRVCERFPAVPESPRLARRLVVDALAAWSDEDVIGDAALVVTELATNAVVHAGSEFAVELVSSTDAVRISVLDGSALLPPAVAAAPAPVTARDLDRVAASGRGLALIGSLARCWGSEPTPDGKRVWAELARRGA